MSKNEHTIEIADESRGRLLAVIADFADGAEHNWLYTVVQTKPLLLSDLAVHDLFEVLNRANRELRKHPAGGLTGDVEELRVALRTLFMNRPVPRRAQAFIRIERGAAR